MDWKTDEKWKEMVMRLLEKRSRKKQLAKHDAKRRPSWMFDIMPKMGSSPLFRHHAVTNLRLSICYINFVSFWESRWNYSSRLYKLTTVQTNLWCLVKASTICLSFGTISLRQDFHYSSIPARKIVSHLKLKINRLLLKDVEICALIFP